MRIVVFGTGGAGGFFGAQLARAGEDVTFIARGAHLRAIREHGLVIEAPAGEVVIRNAGATDDPAEVAGADVVLLGVKAWQVADAAQAMRPLIGPGTFVVPLQNGVEAASQLSNALGDAHVVGGLCGTLSWVTGPGRIRSVGTSNNFVKFAELDHQRSDRTELLRLAFERAGINVEVPADIHKSLWDKFLMVTSFGGVGAVARAPIGVIRSLPETRRLLEHCLQEVCALAWARGIALKDTAVADTLTFYDSLPPSGTTSLQRDIADGKPSELESWNGAIVRLARESGVSAPTHDFIYRCLLPQEKRARGDVTFPA